MFFFLLAPTRALLPVAVIPTQDTKVSAVESRRVSTISNKTVGPPVTQNLSVGAAQNGVFPKLSETSATSAVSSTTLTPVSTLHAGTSGMYTKRVQNVYTVARLVLSSIVLQKVIKIG